MIYSLCSSKSRYFLTVGLSYHSMFSLSQMLISRQEFPWLQRTLLAQKLPGQVGKPKLGQIKQRESAWRIPRPLDTSIQDLLELAVQSICCIFQATRGFGQVLPAPCHRYYVVALEVGRDVTRVPSSEGLYKVRRHDSSLQRFLGVAYRCQRRRREEATARLLPPDPQKQGGRQAFLRNRQEIKGRFRTWTITFKTKIWQRIMIF